MSIRNFALSTAALVCLIAVPSPAKAGFIATFLQVGNDVVATGSGTINTTALTLSGPTMQPALIYPSHGTIVLGPFAGANNVTNWSGVIAGSVAYGTGNLTSASFGSGDFVGVFVSAIIYTPFAYTSGSSLSSSSTWLSTTIAGLGITPGTYTRTWGSGASADFFTLTTTASAATPEPASFTLLALGSLGVLLVRRRRRA